MNVKLEKVLRKIFKALIINIFKNIGPLSKINLKKLQFYEFENGLYFNEIYLSGGVLLKELVLDKIYKNEVNESTSYELFQYIAKTIYDKIKSRIGVIEDTLNTYLEDKEIDCAFSEMFKKLDDSYGEYTLYLLTNLISLRDIETVEIGKAKVKNLNETVVKKLPENIEQSFKSVFYEAWVEMTQVNKYLSHTQFLEEFKGRVILEISVEGYHLNNEMSKVFEKFLREYKHVFSYLSACKDFLGNVKLNSYIIKTEDMGTYEDGVYSFNKVPQIFYIYSKNQPTLLKRVDAEFQKVKLPKILIKIDKDSLENIKKRCCLDNFNEILQNQTKYGEIGEKITRSMDWFYKGIIEEDRTNEAIALFISLEILMSTKPDRYSSLSDELAENLAIITQSGIEDRYRAKKDFKKNIYQLRNDIMHRGTKISMPADFRNLKTLRNCIVWSLRWIIENIEILQDDGKYTTEKLKEYFEKQKLK